MAVNDRKKVRMKDVKGQANVNSNLSNCDLIKASVGGELILRYERATEAAQLITQVVVQTIL